MFNFIKKTIKYRKTPQGKVHKTREEGFTLIELLVVLAIVAILAATVLASLNASRLRANDSRRDEDMRNVKSAIELYGAKYNYDYSGLVAGFSSYVAYSDKKGLAKEGDSKMFDLLSKGTKIAEAQTLDEGCVNFQSMAAKLVADDFLASVPRDPQDSDTVCYKAYTTTGVDDNDIIIAGYALTSREYLRAPSFNKRTGFLVSKSGTDSAPDIACAAFGYPAFDPNSSDQCIKVGNDNKIADSVIGLTKGDEVAVVSNTGGSAGICSDSAYTTQSDCERDRSYCSGGGGSFTDSNSCTSAGYMNGAGCSGGSQYADENSCTSAGYMAGAGCSGGSQYADENSCTSAGYYAGSGCSGGGYSTQQSCVDAGYMSGAGCSGGSGSYNDSSSCTGAGYIVPGYCSNNSYSDISSCTNAGYYTSDYCDDGSYTDQYNCEVTGGSTWHTGGFVSYGYSWTPEVFVSYGYTWNPGTFVSYGYTWDPGTWTSYYYTWSAGTWTSYNYQWSNGTFTSYNYQWNNVPPAVWTPTP